ncbi:arsenate reductase/protein-tyrosine-phosphatase family protein [Blastococcus sp. SYSU DS0619]
MRILFVCRGNRCRSPIAELLATAWGHGMLADSPELAGVEVASLGLEAVAGYAMDPASAAALTALGGDPTGFRTRPFAADLVEHYDLVFTMTRRQRQTVLEASPRGLRRTFTLTEATDLLGQADLTGLALQPLTERARTLARRLDAARTGRARNKTDDIADPIGQKATVHRETAEVIAAALRPLVDVLFTSVRDRLPSPSAA